MVRRFFNSETGIWRFFGWVGDIVMLSLLWVLCSVPLVTMGAASTALYDAAVHVMRRKDDAVFSRFFGTFRRELKTACLTTLLWGALAGLTVLLYRGLVGSAPDGQVVTAWSVIFLLLLYLLLCILSWVFPLLSRFTFGFADLNRTALRLALGNILRSSGTFCAPLPWRWCWVSGSPPFPKTTFLFSLSPVSLPGSPVFSSNRCLKNTAIPTDRQLPVSFGRTTAP